MDNAQQHPDPCRITAQYAVNVPAWGVYHYCATDDGRVWQWNEGADSGAWSLVAGPLPSAAWRPHNG